MLDEAYTHATVFDGMVTRSDAAYQSREQEIEAVAPDVPDMELRLIRVGKKKQKTALKMAFAGDRQ